VFAVTFFVVIVNTGDVVAPAGTVTDTGGEATALLLVRVTVTPPAGAGPVSVTVLLVVLLPPTTVLGDSVSARNAGGLTVSVAVLVAPLNVAETVTFA
jgi:hypothetical protein